MRNETKTKVAKYIVYLIILSIILVVAMFLISYFADTNFIETFLIGLACELLLGIAPLIFKYGKRLFQVIKTIRPYYYDSSFEEKKIRLSFAYLIRIKVNNRYLLVKSGHKRGTYGPVGGVYHIEHTDYVYNKLGFSRDSSPGDPEDIRGTIQGKKISKFIKWFNKKRNRELNPSREFYEELIKTGYVPESLFENPKFNFIKTVYKGIQYGEHYGINELLRFDIYEFVPNEIQLNYLLNIKVNNNLKFYTREEIEKLGVTKNNDKGTIGTQTRYILED